MIRQAVKWFLVAVVVATIWSGFRHGGHEQVRPAPAVVHHTSRHR